MERLGEVLHSPAAFSKTMFLCFVFSFLLASTVTEMNPNVVVISVLAILSILLIGLLLVTLVVLRRKHLQMARYANLPLVPVGEVGTKVPQDPWNPTVFCKGHIIASWTGVDQRFSLATSFSTSVSSQ